MICLDNWVFSGMKDNERKEDRSSSVVRLLLEEEELLFLGSCCKQLSVVTQTLQSPQQSNLGLTNNSLSYFFSSKPENVVFKSCDGQ